MRFYTYEKSQKKMPEIQNFKGIITFVSLKYLRRICVYLIMKIQFIFTCLVFFFFSIIRALIIYHQLQQQKWPHNQLNEL